MRRLLDDQSCALCPALAANRRRIVHGYGDPGSHIIFIGEAPGRHGADRTGVPFSGDKSGRALQRILIALGLLEDDEPAPSPRLRCFVTNVVRCCPPANRTPTPAEVTNCAPLLAFEFDTIEPRIIVPVGRLALRVVGLRYLGYDPGLIRRLHAVPLGNDTRTIVPLIHPSRISHAQIASFITVMRSLLEDDAT